MEIVDELQSPPESKTCPSLVLLPPYRDAVEPKDLGAPLGGDMNSLFDCRIATVDCKSIPIKPFLFSQQNYELGRQKAAKSMTNVASTCVESIRDNNKTKKTKEARWKCHDCGAENPDDESHCLQCNVHRAPQMEAEGWGDLFAGQNQGKWRCSACSVWTSDDEWKCAACETARPGTSDSAKLDTSG
jgi:hypothetical protein